MEEYFRYSILICMSKALISYSKVSKKCSSLILVNVKHLKRSDIEDRRA